MTHCHSPEVTGKGQTVLIMVTQKVYQAYGDNSPEFLRDLGEAGLPGFETLEADLARKENFLGLKFFFARRI